MKTSEKIISLLKIEGALTAKVLALELDLTTMGVRQHLQTLNDQGDISFEDKKAARGRPTRYWSLTTQSQTHFADHHDELTVQLIDSVKIIFGESGLDKLIEHREQASFMLYSERLSKQGTLLEKLQILAELRSAEGYMAKVVIDKNSESEQPIYWLMENHCPICAAASQCLNFCRSELNLFRLLLQGIASVQREEHIIEGARRCAYKVITL